LFSFERATQDAEHDRVLFIESRTFFVEKYDDKLNDSKISKNCDRFIEVILYIIKEKKSSYL
jgi:hypothetical protein